MIPRLNKAWSWQMFPLSYVKLLLSTYLESASNLISSILPTAEAAWVVVVRIAFTECFKCMMVKGTMAKGLFSH